MRLSNEASQAGWTQATYITPDTEAISARATEAYINAVTDFAKRAATFNAQNAAPEQQRKLTVLKNTLTMAAPADPKEAAELARLVTSMDGAYGRGKYCPQGEGRSGARASISRRSPRSSRRIATRPACAKCGRAGTPSRPPMQEGLRALRRALEQGREGARLRRHRCHVASRYDMPPERLREGARSPVGAAAAAVSRRCTPTSARSCTRSTATLVPADGPIPAHLLGNIWAQDWSNVYDLVAPRWRRTRRARSTTSSRRETSQPLEMVRIGERFFTSLGFDAAAEDVLGALALRQAARSRGRLSRERVGHRQRRRPAHQDVHRPDGRGLHDHPSRARAQLLRSAPTTTQPMIFRDSANDGFHEAIGDTIALSVTPEYLVKIGLLDKAPDASGDIPSAAAGGAREARVPAVRPGDRSVAMAGVQRAGHARALQRGVVGAAREVSGRRAAVARAARSSSIRAPSITCRRTRRTRATSSPYVLQFQFHRALAKAAGCTDAAPSLLDLRERGGRRRD